MAKQKAMKGFGKKPSKTSKAVKKKFPAMFTQQTPPSNTPSDPNAPGPGPSTY